MSGKYKANSDLPMFVTSTVVSRIDLFSRNFFVDILIDGLRYSSEKQGMLLHDFVIMPNHLHYIVQHKDGQLSAVLRNFKAHTALRIIKSLENNEVNESRKVWILKLFKYHANFHKQNKVHQVWKKHDRCILLDNPLIYNQKRDYLHLNPVRAGYVKEAEHWIWGSANDDNELRDLILSANAVDM